MGWSGYLTRRQFRAWREWTAEDLNEPSKADYYAMQIAAEVRRVLSKKPGGIKLADFKLVFKPKKPKPPTPQETETAVKLSKAIWMVRSGAVKGDNRGRRKRS